MLSVLLLPVLGPQIVIFDGITQTGIYLHKGDNVFWINYKDKNGKSYGLSFDTTGQNNDLSVDLVCKIHTGQAKTYKELKNFTIHLSQQEDEYKFTELE